MTIRIRALPAVLVVAAILLGACAPASSGARPPVKIGSANFTEQFVLAELYAQALESAGYPVERKLNLGSREIYAPALERGEIDLFAEYLATYLTFLKKDEGKAAADAQGDARKTQQALQDVLRAKNLTVLDPAPAVDTNALVVTKATADKHGLRKTSDLAKQNGQLVLGAPPTCPERPYCLPGFEKTYGLKFKEFKPLDTGGPLTVQALEANQIDVALLFSTDATIQVKGFVLLEDDKKLQAADNIAPVVRNDLLSKAPADFTSVLNNVSSKLTTEELTQLNRQVGVDKKDAKDAAAAWLKAKGIVR